MSFTTTAFFLKKITSSLCIMEPESLFSMCSVCIARESIMVAGLQASDTVIFLSYDIISP